MTGLRRVVVAALVAGGLTYGLGELYLARVDVPVQEDHQEWDCTTDGNRICGPTNAQGAAPGCYQPNGDLVVSWPCGVWVYPDGTSDVYVPGPGQRTTAHP